MPKASSDGPHRPSTDITEILRVLDDNQTLLMALTLVGPDPGQWQAEGMLEMIEQQAKENRRVLGPPGALD